MSLHHKRVVLPKHLNKKHLVVGVCCRGMGSEVLGTSKFSPSASRSIVYTKLYSQI